MNLSLLKRLLPLALIATVVVLFMALDLGRFISFDSLKEHREALNGWVSTYPLLAPLAYMLLYIIIEI